MVQRYEGRAGRLPDQLIQDVAAGEDELAAERLQEFGPLPLPA